MHFYTLAQWPAFRIMPIMSLSPHHTAPINAPILTPPTISIGIPAS